MSLPRVVMTSGVFDVLHRGHLNHLWMARQLGDMLVVGVVGDSGAREYKGQFPLQPVEMRMRNVARLNFVDVVASQDTTDPTPLLYRYRPSVFCHGDDWQRLIRGQETIDQLGIEFVLLPYTPDISSTLLRPAAELEPAMRR